MTPGAKLEAEFWSFVDATAADCRLHKRAFERALVAGRLAAMVDALMTPESPSLELLADKAPRAKRANPAGRNPLFDALALACGINPSEATAAIRRTIGVALADILSVSPGATPDEFRRRAGLYQKKHKDWPLTPTALAKYWGEFGPADGLTWTAKQDVAPEGWEACVRSLYNGATGTYMVALGWEKLGTNLQQSIRKKLAAEVSA